MFFVCGSGASSDAFVGPVSGEGASDLEEFRGRSEPSGRPFMDLLTTTRCRGMREDFLLSECVVVARVFVGREDRNARRAALTESRRLRGPRRLLGMVSMRLLRPRLLVRCAAE